MTELKKHANLSEETHSRLMQYKAKLKLKTLDQTISKLLEIEEWTA
jgi:hypothetical protein